MRYFVHFAATASFALSSSPPKQVSNGKLHKPQHAAAVIFLESYFELAEEASLAHWTIWALYYLVFKDEGRLCVHSFDIRISEWAKKAGATKSSRVVNAGNYRKFFPESLFNQFGWDVWDSMLPQWRKLASWNLRLKNPGRGWFSAAFTEEQKLWLRDPVVLMTKDRLLHAILSLKKNASRNDNESSVDEKPPSPFAMPIPTLVGNYVGTISVFEDGDNFVVEAELPGTTAEAICSLEFNPTAIVVTYQKFKRRNEFTADDCTGEFEKAISINFPHAFPNGSWTLSPGVVCESGAWKWQAIRAELTSKVTKKPKS